MSYNKICESLLKENSEVNTNDSKMFNHLKNKVLSYSFPKSKEEAEQAGWNVTENKYGVKFQDESNPENYAENTDLNDYYSFKNGEIIYTYYKSKEDNNIEVVEEKRPNRDDFIMEVVTNGKSTDSYYYANGKSINKDSTFKYTLPTRPGREDSWKSFEF